MSSTFEMQTSARVMQAHVFGQLVLLLTAGFLLAPSRVRAADFPQWGALEPGRFGVGFRTINAYDRTRAFIAARDYAGNELSGERGRPIQIRLWYPTSGEQSGTMQYAEYVYMRATAMDFGPLTDVKRSEEERAFAYRKRRRENFSDAEIESILRTPTAAVRDAAPAPGRFPVVLVPPQGSLHSWVLYEYLASHGYVVAIVPSHGRLSRNVPESVSNAYETAVRDMEFAFGALHDVAEADVTRLGLLAYSSVSLHSILFQSRQLAASAIVAIEGWEGFLQGKRILAERPGYDPAAFRIPYMLIKKAKEEHNPNFVSERDFFDAITFSDRYRVVIAGAEHHDFITLAHIANRQAEKRPIHDAACHITRLFFDAHLRSDTSGLQSFVETPQVVGLPADDITIEHVVPEPALPTQRELVRMLEQGGERLAEARRIVESAGEATSLVPEPLLIDLGYSLMREGAPHVAVDVFQIAVQAFPISANAHDSLSDAHEAAGDRASALRVAQRALDLLDADPSLDEARRERLRTALVRKLGEWQEQRPQN